MPDDPNGELATVEQGGFATHAATDDTDPEADDPLTVHGVALGEGIAHGTNDDGNTPTYYPADVLEDAAALLEGRKLTDGSNHDDLESKHPPNDAIVGDVLNAKHEPGVGVVFEGQVHREPERSLVEQGRMDVSPAVFRSVGGFDDDLGGKPAERIGHWRDVAVLSDGGSPDATINPGPAPADAGAAEALQAEALAAVFDPERPDARARAADTAKDAGSGQTGETMSVSESDGEGGGGGGDPETESEDGEAESESGDGLESMSKEELVSKVEDLQSEKNDMRETLAELKGQVKALGGDVESLQAIFGVTEDQAVESMAEHTGLSEDVVREKFSTPEMVAELNSPETEAEALSLTPEPNTGDPDPTNEEDDGPGMSGLSDDDREELESLAARAREFDSIDEDHAETLREQAADVAGVEEFADLEGEVV